MHGLDKPTMNQPRDLTQHLYTLREKERPDTTQSVEPPPRRQRRSSSRRLAFDGFFILVYMGLAAAVAMQVALVIFVSLS